MCVYWSLAFKFQCVVVVVVAGIVVVAFVVTCPATLGLFMIEVTGKMPHKPNL